MKKPSVFISSTIYDFKDLRSALKYWLTEMGFDVQSSETNDFDVDTSKNSYDACLETIEKCDFFILLIGSRVGGWYNKNEQISITMAEYNKAYSLACEGKIKIINFVRKEIFDIKEDRKSLEYYLKEREDISDELKKDITHHSSKFINNAEFIINFINHVAKNTQMRASLNGNKPLPSANWIFQFTNYEEIIEVLKAQLMAKNDINYKIHCENIKFEINKIITSFCFDRGEGKMPLVFPYKSLTNIMEKMPTVTEGVICLTKKELNLIFLCNVEFLMFQNEDLSTMLVVSAITSGVFYMYDYKINAFIKSNLQKALIELNSNINNFFSIHKNYTKTSYDLSVYINKLLNKLTNNEETVCINLVENVSLLNLFGLYNIIYNIIELSKFILSEILSDQKEISYPQLKNSIFKKDSTLSYGKKPEIQDIYSALGLK